MKRILRLISFSLIGFVVGSMGVIAGILLSSDLTLQEIVEKILETGLLFLLGRAIFSIFAFLLAGYLQIIVHEGGHLIFGCMAGFRFVSFRIGSWTLIRQSGRLRLKQFAVAGTGGQCLLSPPDTGITFSAFAWYNMGGVLMNLLMTLAALTIWVLLKPLPASVDVFLLFFSIVGFLFVLTNGIPLRMSGINNDGYNMLSMLRQDKQMMQVLHTQFRINALMQEGVRLKEMPAEWFSDEPVTNYKDVLQVGTRILFAGRYADMKEYDKAYTLYNELLEHKNEIIGLYVKELTCEVLLLELIGECRKEEIERLYTKDIKEYISKFKKVMSGKQVIACALELYWEKKPDEAIKIYEQVIRQKEKYLMQGEVASSIETMEDMLGISVKKDDSVQ